MKTFKELNDWARGHEMKPISEGDNCQFATVIHDGFNINLCHFISKGENDMMEIRIRPQSVEAPNDIEKYGDLIMLLSFNDTKNDLYIVTEIKGTGGDWKTTRGPIDEEIATFPSGTIKPETWKQIIDWLLIFDGGIPKEFEITEGEKNVLRGLVEELGYTLPQSVLSMPHLPGPDGNPRDPDKDPEYFARCRAIRRFCNEVISSHYEGGN